MHAKNFPTPEGGWDIAALTALFASDPELRKHGVKADYWKTGHSHMKRRVHELGALAGFEKSGHYFLADPIGRGYDDGMRVAVEICKLMERNPEMKMSDLRRGHKETIQCGILGHKLRLKLRSDLVGGLMNAGA